MRVREMKATLRGEEREREDIRKGDKVRALQTASLHHYSFGQRSLLIIRETQLFAKGAEKTDITKKNVAARGGWLCVLTLCCPLFQWLHH